MNLRKIILFALGMMLLTGGLYAQVDNAGAVDTMYLEPYQIDAKNWAVNVSLFNDEEIIAISLPVIFSAGTTKIVADSTVFTGGRVDHFRIKTARVDTTAQCLTIGLIWDLGVSVPPMAPGTGRIATIFISALDGSDITESLKIDTTTTNPNNSLQMVMPDVKEVIPALVIKPAEMKKQNPD
ncbi:MAG TPA: hypothetical protein ENL22_00900 [candidate division Zixibacteria bacterium]|nr:hypothetical protein [candidate division Zixibacteria bacterium]